MDRKERIENLETEFQKAWVAKDWDKIWDCVYNCSHNILAKMCTGHKVDPEIFEDRLRDATANQINRMKNAIAKDENYQINKLVNYLHAGVVFSWRSPKNVLIDQELKWDDLKLDEKDEPMDRLLKEKEENFIMMDFKTVKAFLKFYKDFKKEHKEEIAREKLLQEILDEKNLNYKLLGEILEALLIASENHPIAKDLVLEVKTKDSAKLTFKFVEMEDTKKSKIETFLEGRK